MPSIQSISDSPPPSLDELCEQALNLQIAGQLGPAQEIYGEILRAQPLHAAANHCVGILLVHLKRPADGLPHLLTALRESPGVPDYWLGCLEALLLIDKTEEAGNLLASARRNGLPSAAFDDFAHRLAAHRAAAHRSEMALPRPAEAPPGAPSHAEPLKQASKTISARAKILSPRRQEQQLEVMLKQARFVEALALARELTECHPERGSGWKVLGGLLWAEKRQDEALTAMRTAVRLLPKDAEVRRNLGAALNAMERYEEAEICLRQALHIDPTSIAAHNDLGEIQSLKGRPDEAEASYRNAISLTAGRSTTAFNDRLYTSLLYTMSHNPRVDADSLFAEHCRVAEHIEGGLRTSMPRHVNDPNPERRLRVGFVSGDFFNHSVANFIEPIWAKLRASQAVELHAYYNKDTDDAVTRRLRDYVQRWRPVVRLSDQELAQQIKDDQIDILIDLSGHTSLNRLRAFARKPAPIQASWIGYPGTTGLRAMDYYLADPHFLPPGQFEQSFTEKIVYLPAAWAFEPHVSSPPVNGLPALETGFVTFGSFNRSAKLNPFTVRLWSRLLRGTPGSIIVLAGIPLNERRQALTELFLSEGIVSERVAFFPRSNMETYLALHHQIDICLDTFPYTGGTTTNHALWMGVPTLTLAGQTPAARQCAANLSHLGLEKFIASNQDDFVQKGLFWSTEIAALADVRRGLRERWLASPLGRPEIIASGLEAALRHMWQRWCKDLPAQSFSVTASNQISP